MPYACRWRRGGIIHLLIASRAHESAVRGRHVTVWGLTLMPEAWHYLDRPVRRRYMRVGASLPAGCRPVSVEWSIETDISGQEFTPTTRGA